MVEGSDDVQVIKKLKDVNLRGVAFETWQREGIDNLLRAIPLEYISEGRVALGIVVDADDNLRFRWNDIIGQFRKVRVDLPDNPEPGGTILETERARVGIWIMPDNQSEGQLEDFIFNMIPAGDPVWPCADRFIEDIPPLHRKFSETKVLRAKVSAWLATRHRPRPMWSAIEQEDLVLETNSQAFLDWLKRLFGDDIP